MPLLRRRPFKTFTAFSKAARRANSMGAAKHIAWSYSRLHTFEECAKQFYHLNVAPRGHPDRIEYVQNEEGKEGDRVHKALDARISSRTPLPANLAYLEPAVQSILEVP